MSGLAEQQAALVRALVARGPVPDGFDPARMDATIDALLRKRTDDAGRAWPALLATPELRARFTAWADGRPKITSYDDGLTFAVIERRRGTLPPAALRELRRRFPRRRRPFSGRRRRLEDHDFRPDDVGSAQATLQTS